MSKSNQCYSCSMQCINRTTVKEKMRDYTIEHLHHQTWPKYLVARIYIIFLKSIRAPLLGGITNPHTLVQTFTHNIGKAKNK